MQKIEYTVITASGDDLSGVVQTDNGHDFIQVGLGDKISLHLDQSQILTILREGDDLVVVLLDGRRITLDGYFVSDAELFISADGELYRADIVEPDSDGATCISGYTAVDVSGKWSPYDRLVFEDDGVLLAPETALGPTSLAGPFLWSAAALGVLAQDDDGHARQIIRPSVDHPEARTMLTTNTVDPAASVTGTGEPGSAVRVSLGNQSIETTVGQDGTWGATFSGPNFPSDGDLTSTVSVVAPDGTQYELDGPDFLIDMTRPLVEVTDGVLSTGDVENLAEYQDGITIRGTGEAGASVVVEVAWQTQQATVAADGTWSVTFTTNQLPGGEYSEEMTVTSTDAHGNVSTITETLVVDTVPNAIEFNPVAGDNVLNAVEAAGAVVVSGTSTPGAMLAITMEGVTQQTSVAADGTWAVTYGPGVVPVGTYDSTITATSIDTAENPSNASLSVHVDTEASVAFASGPVTSDNVVNAAESTAGFSLTGTAEPGSRVVIKLGNATVSPTVAADGSWSADLSGTGLTTGAHVATVTATDAYGNTASETMVLNFDTETVVAFDAAQVGSDDLISGTERGAGVMLTGTAEAGASVAVAFQGFTRTVTAAADGSWSANFAPGEIAPGTYAATATATATDLAGNVAVATHVLNVDTEVQPLSHATPTPNSIVVDGTVNAAEGANGLVVSGTVEAGSSVLVQLGSGAPVQASVSGTTWTTTIPAGALPSGEYQAVVLNVSATDSHGNTSSQTSTIDFDTVLRYFALTGPAAGDGIVNANEADTGFAISGTAEVRATVLVTLANGAERSVAADASGKWSTTFYQADLQTLSGNMTYTVSATDRAGNQATLTDATVQKFSFDLAAPDAPIVTDKSDDGLTTRSLFTSHSEAAHFVISTVAENGTVTTVLDADPIPLGDDDLYDFGRDGRIPNGSYLVVTDTDTSGNTASTLVVVDGNSNVTVDLARPGLDRFDFSSITLEHTEATLTITEAQILALTGPSRTLAISGDAGDSVTALGATDTGGDVLIGGQSHSIYAVGSSGALLAIDDHITNLTL